MKKSLVLEKNTPSSVLKALLLDKPLVYTEAGFYEYEPNKQYWLPIPRQDVANWFLRSCEEYKEIHYPRHKKDKAGEWHTEMIQLEPSRSYAEVAAYSMHAPELVRPDFFSSTVGGFTCRNGFVELTPKGPVMVPRSKDNRSKIYLDAVYDPKNECPFTESVMDSYFTRDNDKAGKTRALWEFMAYCLTGQMCFDERGTILWVTGAKRAGKTTLVKALIAAIFPREFVASVEPQRFGDPNQRLDLLGKLINFRDEVGSKALVDVGTIKNIVSGSVTDIKKLYRDPIQGRIEAGHLFVANEMPIHADPTGALQDRTVHIIFDQPFDREAESPKRIQDHMIEERSGIINLLLRYYYEAQAREPFEKKSVYVPQSAKDSREEMTREANAYIDFIEEALEYDPEARTGIADIASQFEAWKRHTRRTYGPNPNLSQLGKKILAERPDFRVSLKGHAAVYGVRLKDFEKRARGEN